MGNVQITPLPRVITPIETYFPGPEFTFVQSLGNTRFMKVARVKYEGVPMMAKVFVFPDQAFDAKKFLDEIKKIDSKLGVSTYSNCFGYTVKYRKEWSHIILLRPFHKDTLHDRMNIQPFLVDVEKRWIAFQLLKALEECKRAEIVHGDIKSTNLLISSSTWVTMADFASFKPTFFPSDNPSTFTFFFNPNRLDGCNIAPERLKPSRDIDSSFNREFSEMHKLTADRTYAMDIFSCGCVLVELFSSKPAFTFRELMEYQQAEYVEMHMNRICNSLPEELRELITIMLERDPLLREAKYTAYAPFHAPNLFPPIFESFLYHYIGGFRKVVTMSRKVGNEDRPFNRVVPILPDEAIIKLHVERNQYFEYLKKDNSQAVVLLISLVTSNIRSCRTVRAKIDAVQLLDELSQHATENIIAERIVPYLVKLFSDKFTLVQTEAIHVLIKIIANFKKIPVVETRLFVDYIIPEMRHLLQSEKTSPMTLMAVAGNLGILARTAFRFFQEGMNHAREAGGAIGTDTTDGPKTENVKETTAASKLNEVEKQSLLVHIREMFTKFITMDNYAVQQALLAEDNLTKLCHFFHDVGASSDDILEYLGTTCKPNWRMKVSFFKNCQSVIIKNRKGWFFIPYLKEGLQSAEEFVVLEALRCIYAFRSNNLFDNATIFGLFDWIVPFLVHPNIWLRIATVDILKLMDDVSPFEDVYCRLLPKVRMFLTAPLIRLNDKTAIHEVLVDPIPRDAWTIVTKCKDPVSLLSELENEQNLARLGGGRHSSFTPSIDTNPAPSGRRGDVSRVIQKLQNCCPAPVDGRATLEDKIIAFRPILEHMERRSKDSNFQVLTKIPPVHTFDFEGGVHDSRAMSTLGVDSTADMLGSNANLTALPRDSDMTSRAVLEALFQHKRDQYHRQTRLTSSTASAHRLIAGASAFGKSVSASGVTGRDPGSFKTPEIRVAAHLHEHSGPITKLAPHGNGTVFATSSQDQTVKLWNLSQVHTARASPVTSVSTEYYRHPVNCLQFMTDNENHLVAGSEGGELSIFDIERDAFLNCTLNLDPEHDGGITQLFTADHLIYALTVQSNIYGLDKRVANNKAAFSLENILQRRIRNAFGYVTSMTVDPIRQHWMAITSSTFGTRRSERENPRPYDNIMLLDLRFLGLPIADWSHSSRAPCTASWPVITGGNDCRTLATAVTMEGEVSLWNLASMHERKVMLWPGSTLVAPGGEIRLEYRNELRTTAFAQSATHSGIFTGDSDGSLRFWGLTHRGNDFEVDPKRCQYLSGRHRPYLIPPLVNRQTAVRNGQSQQPNPQKISYHGASYDGASVVFEERPPISVKDADLCQRPVGEQHFDGITDIGLLGPDYLASSARNGVVKVWRVHNT
uniref:non-specific serine/threonine protein kinase n=1 Tax=Panagrellus redivivus TaxID=6233 RepID=A0A7E4VWM4_PANRE